MGRPIVNVAVGGNKQESVYRAKVIKPSIPLSLQLVDEDIVYIIKSEVNLNNDNITVPENCVLQFEGGNIVGEGIIIGTNTVINSPATKIFGLNVVLEGTWRTDRAYAEWFGEEPSTLEIQKTIDTFNRWDLLSNATYILTDTIHISPWDWSNMQPLAIEGHGNSWIKFAQDEGVMFDIGGVATGEIPDDKRFSVFRNLFITHPTEDNDIKLFYSENGMAQCLFDCLFVNNIAYVWYFNELRNADDNPIRADYWDIKYSHCRLGHFHKGFYCKRGFHNHFDSCYFGEPIEGGVCIELEATSRTLFENCNFGGSDVPMQFYISHPNSFQNTFSHCNFEEGKAGVVENDGVIDEDESRKLSLFYVYWGTDVTFDSCNFLFYKGAGEGYVVGAKTSASINIINSRIDNRQPGNPAFANIFGDCFFKVDDYTAAHFRGIDEGVLCYGNWGFPVNKSNMPLCTYSGNIYYGLERHKGTLIDKFNNTSLPEFGLLDGTPFFNTQDNTLSVWNNEEKKFIIPNGDGFPRWYKKGGTALRNNIQNMKDSGFTVDDYGYVYFDWEYGQLCVIKNFTYNNDDPDREITGVVWVNALGEHLTKAAKVGYSVHRPVGIHTEYQNPSDPTDISPIEDGTHTVPIQIGTLVLPTANSAGDIGHCYFDRSIGKPIYVKEIDANNGNVTWVDALGNPPGTQYSIVATSNTDNTIGNEEDTSESNNE